MHVEIFEIIRHETKAFFYSGFSSLILLLVTILIWGSVIAGKVENIHALDSWVWVVFFAMVVTAGFSTTVFVRERLSATLEILLVSGVERSSVLYGKIIFTSVFTIFTGLAAFFVAWFGRSILFSEEFFLKEKLFQTVSLYISTSCMMTASSAMLSLSLTNPRLVQFVNFTILMGIVLAYAIASQYYPISLYILCLFESMFAILFVIISRVLFNREKIIQPLVY